MSCRAEFLRNMNSLRDAYSIRGTSTITIGAQGKLNYELFFKKSVLVGHWGILTRLESHDGPPGFPYGEFLKYP